MCTAKSPKLHQHSFKKICWSNIILHEVLNVLTLLDQQNVAQHGLMPNNLNYYIILMFIRMQQHKYFAFSIILSFPDTVISTNVVGSKHEAKRQDQKFTWDFFE